MTKLTDHKIVVFLVEPITCFCSSKSTEGFLVYIIKIFVRFKYFIFKFLKEFKLIWPYLTKDKTCFTNCYKLKNYFVKNKNKNCLNSVYANILFIRNQ